MSCYEEIDGEQVIRKPDLLTPYAVDRYLYCLLKEFVKDRKPVIIIAKTATEVSQRKRGEDFIQLTFIDTITEQAVDFNTVIQVDYQLLIGSHSRDRCWICTEELQNYLEENDFMCNLSAEDKPAVDNRLILFVSYNKGSQLLYK